MSCRKKKNNKYNIASLCALTLGDMTALSQRQQSRLVVVRQLERDISVITIISSMAFNRSRNREMPWTTGLPVSFLSVFHSRKCVTFRERFSHYSLWEITMLLKNRSWQNSHVFKVNKCNITVRPNDIPVVLYGNIVRFFINIGISNSRRNVIFINSLYIYGSNKLHCLQCSLTGCIHVSGSHCLMHNVGRQRRLIQLFISWV